jgi:broad specificity phosphatase PhoE
MPPEGEDDIARPSSAMTHAADAADEEGGQVLLSSLGLDETTTSSLSQSLIVIRHGDRWDYENPDWNRKTTRPGDPPLSALGHQQARETGVLLDSLLSSLQVDGNDVTLLSSPFLRTLQTSDGMLSALRRTKNARNIQILPESSIFEWDGKENGLWHASLPSLEERWNYFPRLNVKHPSLFVPDLPEPRSKFVERCDRAVKELNGRYPYQPRSVIVLVTHAAGCVGLCRAATHLPLQQIAPAAPCGIYRMTRRSRSSDDESSVKENGPQWTMDLKLNGYVGHLSEMGATVPWNHFGNSKTDRHRGYTGPVDSPLAPESVRLEQQQQQQQQQKTLKEEQQSSSVQYAAGENQ